MTSFTKALAVINLLGAIVSISMFVATWFTQGMIVATAKKYALNSTQKHLEPVVKFLENPKLTGKLPDSVEARMLKELADYRDDPNKWLLEIADGTRDRAADFDFPEVKNPLARTGLAFLTDRVSQAAAHFKKSYVNLITDLRIFCGTNACAFLIAAWLCFVAKTKTMRHWLGAWSTALLLATILMNYFYVNQSWAWTIVFNRYYGWSYALMHALIAIYLFYKVEPGLRATMPLEEN